MRALLTLVLALGPVVAVAGTPCPPTTVLLGEDFVDPTGWTRDPPPEARHHVPTWYFDNPGGRTLPTLTEPFAIADSDFISVAMDTTLTSPEIDASGLDCLSLVFNHHYRAHGTQQGDVLIRSAATAGSWVAVASYSTADDVALVTVDIGDLAGPGLQVRFHFHDAVFDWYWAVDDVVVGTSPGFLFADGFESATTDDWSVVVR